MTNNRQYTYVARLLHWLVAALIVAQYVLAELSEWAKEADNVVERLALLANHKSIGMTILALAAVRLTWRLFNKPPALPLAMPEWQKFSSHAAHWLIYGVIFCLPLSGWLMSSANAYSVSWFNLFVFPDLVAADKSLADFFHSTHEIMTEVLFVVVVVHVLAALKHHYLDKDGVLNRMASWFGWLVFIAVLLVTVVLFGRIGSSPPKASLNRDAFETVSNGSQIKSENFSESVSLSDLPVWSIDYQNSAIKFSADQAGAPFEGVWEKWQAVMQFDAAQLNKSGFIVTIDTTQVNSKDQERDGYIVGEDFFDTNLFKTATFIAEKFEPQSSNEFTSQGRLSIKGLSKPVLFTFTVVQTEGLVELIGSASLDRFAWNIGMGDWTDTSWVGQQVKVNVKVVATIDE